MKLECKKCNKQVKVKKGRSKKVKVLLLILGFLTFGVGWLILIIYCIVKPKYQCSECSGKIKS